jgi:hypothetical protein
MLRLIVNRGTFLAAGMSLRTKRRGVACQRSSTYPHFPD